MPHDPRNVGPEIAFGVLERPAFSVATRPLASSHAGEGRDAYQQRCFVRVSICGGVLVRQPNLESYRAPWQVWEVFLPCLFAPNHFECFLKPR